MLIKSVKTPLGLLILLFAILVGLICFDYTPDFILFYMEPIITAVASVICTGIMLSYYSKSEKLWRLVAIFILGFIILCLVTGSVCISFLIGFFVQGIFLICQRATTRKL